MWALHGGTNVVSNNVQKRGVPKRRAGHFVASALRSNRCCSNLSKYQTYERCLVPRRRIRIEREDAQLLLDSNLGILYIFSNEAD